MVSRREVGIMISNPMYWFCMVVFPLLTMFFFTSLMDSGQPHDMPVGVVDLDNTSTSRKLIRNLDAFQTSRVVARYESVAEARAAIQRNEIYAFIYIPKGTADKLLSSRQPKISFFYSLTSLTSGALLFRDLKTISTLGSASVAQATMSAKGYTPEQIKTFLQPILIDLHQPSNPWTNYNVYLSTVLVPGMIMLFAFLITAYSLGTELKFSRSKHWLASAGNNMPVAMAGKIIPQTIVFLAVTYGYMYSRFPASWRYGAYCAFGTSDGACLAGLRRVHIRSYAFIAPVDEYLFALGCAQFLHGRLGVSRHGYGRGVAVSVVALSAASLFHDIPAGDIQWLPAGRCHAAYSGSCRFCAVALGCAA